MLQLCLKITIPHRVFMKWLHHVLVAEFQTDFPLLVDLQLIPKLLFISFLSMKNFSLGMLSTVSY